MAQLSDDRFAFGGSLLGLDAALDDLARRLRPVVSSETVALDAARGHVLAQDALSGIDVPGFDNSAVDGYACRHADLGEGETCLPVSARIAAGMRDIAPLVPGTAARIFTGAMMPEGADTVFMQEDVRVEGDRVILPPGLKPGANRRFAGEDFAAGAPLLAAGTRLGPRHIAALAATGMRRIAVRRPLRVAIFSTGDEVMDGAATTASDLPKGAQFDSNRPLLAALLATRGMEVIDLGILPDRKEAIARALGEAARACDAILTSGGVSTGEEDHVKAAVEAAGKLDFWRLAIKPGRPIAMGTIGGKAFLGMPGNPAAVYVTFVRFVGPVLDMLAGAVPLRPAPMSVISGFSYRKKADRREYVRVSISAGASGPVAHRYPRDGAALISSLTQTDGLVELEESRLAVEKGDVLAYYPYASLSG
ncbi:MAG: molybdopterin molybdotransferase MoeA [Proteobacteria bacterium]|nr:molybdopterin molybdotransferase MoeA [Pseudomonadota bacterium]